MGLLTIQPGTESTRSVVQWRRSQPGRPPAEPEGQVKPRGQSVHAILGPLAYVSGVHSTLAVEGHAHPAGQDVHSNWLPR